MEKVFKIHVDVNLQIFFSSIYIYILGSICLSCLPLNCHYHQIGFALNTGCQAIRGQRHYQFNSHNLKKSTCTKPGELSVIYKGMNFAFITMILSLIWDRHNLCLGRSLFDSQKWQILISVNRDLHFFYFLRFVTSKLSANFTLIQCIKIVAKFYYYDIIINMRQAQPVFRAKPIWW
jgi:hypothetical protein